MTCTYRLTSESVTEGHPDKICDQVSDALLDSVMEQDPMGRVAIETLVTTGTCVVAGEMTTECYVDVEDIVRGTVRDIGYTRAKYGYDCESIGVLTAIHKQSADIAQGVDTGGAGDQGMMFGYACTETEELMPLPIMLAHKLAAKLAAVRKSGQMDYLRPDGKTQVTVLYEDDRPVGVTKVLIAAQHSPDVGIDDIERDINEYVVEPVIPSEMCSLGLDIAVNCTGRFVVGGPQADTGLTGRKIIVDTYGGLARHGGGAFSGKDPTKVDRSGAYMMRYIAKNLGAAGVAVRCDRLVSAARGDPAPFSVAVFTFGTNRIPDARISEIVEKLFDLSPRGMIEHLDLRRPIYKKTAAYGHFGRSEPEFTWEKTDAVDAIRAEAGL